MFMKERGMNHRIAAAFFGLLLLQGCEKKELVEVASPGEVFDGKWSSEEHWMVASTVKDLQGMAKLGGNGIGEDSTVPSKVAHEYQVGKVALKMAPSCWDLAGYRNLLESWRPSPQVSGDPAPDLLHDLLAPTAASLQKANLVVSERIKATPSAALVHEEAAFLLGVFGFRQNARQFGDLRPLLSRMTAHLAVAEHLRGEKEPSEIGRWALVLYDLHAGRPLQAREKIQTIAAEGDAGRWKRVVELLITGDWRRTQDLAEPSLAEVIAHARALEVHRGNTEMMEFVGHRKDLQATPEWSRMLSGPQRSVDDGHLAMRSCIAMEFLEIGEIFRIGKNPSPAKLAEFLASNTPAGLVGADGAPKVISDSDWAAYFRRHFFMICGSISRFTERQWGAHEATVEWEQAVLPYCRKLPDNELVEPLIASAEKDFQEDMRKTAEYTRHHPERVPMGLWFDYRFPNLQTRASGSMPDQVPWFREVSPPGTAYDPTYSIRFSGIQDSSWVNHIRALHQIDPWNSELCYELAENTGNNPDSVKASWGEVREYSRRPLQQTLEGPKLTVEQRIETLRILIGIDPAAGLDLGAELVAVNLPEEAIKAYNTAYEKCPDRVLVSNLTRWMIYYYKSKGNDAKAREIADHNAKVFSLAGLESALALAIADKDSKRANEIAADIAERYNEKSAIPSAAWFAGGSEAALHQVFPEGLKQVTTADFEGGKPVRGSQVTSNSSTAKALGIKSGDVIVAVDGKRVEDFKQYVMLMGSALDPHTRLIYRRGKQVVEVDCQLPDRRLQVDMHDFGQ